MLLETFGQLARDPAHWQFELFVGFIETVVFDVVVGALVWPAIKDHIHRDINRMEDQHGHTTFLRTDDVEPQHGSIEGHHGD